MNKLIFKKSVLLTSLLFSIILLVTVEFIARFGLGLGDPPLFEPSDEYGYRFKPNQNIRRFHNKIFFNNEGLRSRPMSEKPAANTVRILCIGDSITYGGALTDQRDTYPYILAGILNRHTKKKYEVLNASAPSWGIENEEAYLKKHGIFNSHIMVLQIGSTDLYQPKSDSGAVGCSPQYPVKKPFFALQELSRYLLPYYCAFLPPTNCLTKKAANEPNKILADNLSSLKRIVSLTRSYGARIIVVFVGQATNLEPEILESKSTKKKIEQLMHEMDVVFLNLGEAFKEGGDSNLFRDGLHPNKKGNVLIAEKLSGLI